MAAARGRGRPREFDPDEALDAALETFRAHGYSGTSIEELADATDLNRPSLYAAFGNKRALFEACIERYWRRVRERFAAALRSTGTLEGDLRAFFTTYLDEMCRTEAGGCFVVCALPIEVERDPSLRPILAAILAQSDRALAARLEAARAAGELRAGVAPGPLGALIVGAVMSLSLRVRAGASRRSLDAIAEQLVALCLAGAAAPRRRRR
jgi:TetR/AcrR family transcriptional regulator, copper-responsive repressor